MPEYRRILLDGAAVETVRDGDELVAGDGRRVKADEARHLPPVVPSKVIAVHLNHRSRVEEFQIGLPGTPTCGPPWRNSPCPRPQSPPPATPAGS
ncbi:hypothetical protein ACWDE9_46970, partial [Streptomyces olivaceoviridis]